MPAGSPTIWVVPLSKIVAVCSTTGAPFTQMLLNDATQKLYSTEGVSVLATNQCFWTITDLTGQRHPGEVASKKCAVCATKEEFRAGWS
jgi:1,2-phenylacetyl-CoA epoxidase PaaB subunit